MPAPLPVDWLKRLGINDILGVKVEDWDYIYTGIYCDEVCYENCLTIYNRKVIDWLFANRWPGLVSVALVAP